MIMLFNIISIILFLAWPMVLFTSFMSFDAPGSENDFKLLITVVRVLCYPLYLSALYLIFGVTFFGFSGISLFISSIAIIWFGLSVFGYVDKVAKLYERRTNSQYKHVASNRRSFMFWMRILAFIFLRIEL